MDLGIKGRKAIVCASSRGLGLACAKALATAGCEVVINGRDRERLAAAAAELKKTGAKVDQWGFRNLIFASLSGGNLSRRLALGIPDRDRGVGLGPHRRPRSQSVWTLAG